jgi:hypothetical protein
MVARGKSGGQKQAMRIVLAAVAAVIVTGVYFLFVNPPSVPEFDVEGTKMERRLREQKRTREMVEAAKRRATETPAEVPPAQIFLGRPSR